MQIVGAAYRAGQYQQLYDCQEGLNFLGRHPGIPEGGIPIIAYSQNKGKGNTDGMGHVMGQGKCNSRMAIDQANVYLTKRT